MGESPAGNRAVKQRLVEEGNAHAALVFDGDRAVGWCQFGTPDELPRIYHRKQYEAGLVAVADYRITCFFVDRDYRRQGVSEAALDGALGLIADAGGGLVEAFPQDTGGKKGVRVVSTTALEASSSKRASTTNAPRARTIVR